MTNETIVYGASDDLIELGGNVYEEYNVYDTPVYLLFDNKIILKVTYETFWSIKQVAGSTENIFHTVARETVDPEAFGDDSDGCPSYSDKVVVPNPSGAPPKLLSEAAFLSLRNNGE